MKNHKKCIEVGWPIRSESDAGVEKWQGELQPFHFEDWGGD